MTHYKNAALVLPPRLLAAVQRHAAGMQLYVPRAGRRAGWGERSGAREALARRNKRMREAYRAGAGVEDLMAEHGLGYDSVRKIVTSDRRADAAVSRRAGKNPSTQSRG